MNPEPRPPKAYEDFVQRFPTVAQAWELLQQAGRQGPLDEKSTRLLKLGIAVGALREGAIRSSVRKALAVGVSPAEIEQVIALAAPTIGLPSAVAVFTWIQDLLTKHQSPS